MADSLTVPTSADSAVMRDRPERKIELDLPADPNEPPHMLNYSAEEVAAAKESFGGNRDIASVPAATPTTGMDPGFDSVIANIKSKTPQTVKQNMFVAEDIHPEREAEVIRLADRFKTNPDFIRDNYDDFARKAGTPDESEMLTLFKDNPKLTRFMADSPSNAALVKDDVPALSKVESFVGAFTSLPKETANQFNQGYTESVQTMNLLGAAFGLGNNDVFAKQIADQEKFLKDLREKSSPLVKDFEEGSRPAIEKISRGGSQLQNFFSYNEVNKISQDGKILEALKDFSDGTINTLGGLIDYLTEAGKNPRGFVQSTVVKGLPSFGTIIGPSAVGGSVAGPLGAAGGTFAGFAASGIAGDIKAGLQEAHVDLSDESAVKDALNDFTLMQNIRDHALKKGITTSAVISFLGGLQALTGAVPATRTANALAESAKITTAELAGQSAAGDKADLGSSVKAGVDMLGYGFMHAPHSDMRSEYSSNTVEATKEVVSDTNQALKAEHGVAVLRELKQAVDEAKLTKRLPEKLGEFVASAGEDGKVFYQKSDWDNYWRGQNLSPARAAEQVMGDGGQAYHEAEASGAQLQIPLDKYVTEIMTTDHFDGLLPITKTVEDGMTFEEASDHMKNVQGLVSQLSKEATGETDHPEVESQLQEIKKKHVEELTALGQPPDQAEKNAELQSRSIGRIAKDAGLTPNELIEKYPLRFQSGAEPEGGTTLNQNQSKTETPEFKRWFGESKAVDEFGSPKVFYHGTPSGDFDQFYHSNTDGVAGFFTEDKSFAKKFAEDPFYSQRGIVSDGEENPKIYEVYLKADNTFDYSNHDHVEKVLGNLPIKKLREITGTDGDKINDKPINKSQILQQIELGNFKHIEQYQFVDAIKKAGFDSMHIYEEGRKNIAVFDANQIKSVDNVGTFDPNDPRMLFQNNGDKQGQINFSPKNEAVVNIFNKDNPTTTTHEFSHYVVNTLGQLAKDGIASPENNAMLNSLLNHVGAESFEKMTTGQHEKLAREWEAYLFRGEAPNRELRQTFSQMRQWFIDTYKSLKSFMAEHGATLSKNVTDVFDRLVSTDEELARAKKEQAINSLFDKPEEIGMTPKQAEEYKSAIQNANDAAMDELTGKTMDFIRKKNTKEFNARLNAKKSELTKQLNDQPGFVAKSILENGTLPDGTLVESVEGLKLSKSNIVENFGEEAVRDLSPKTYSEKGKLKVDEAAELFGFSSGDELIRTLRATPEIDDVVNEAAENQLRAEGGDITLNPAELQEAAVKAVQSEDRSQLMQKEIQHMVSDEFATFKKLVKKLSGRIPTVEEVRSYAEDQIAGEKVGLISPNKYKIATAQASREALDLFLKGDFQGALDARKRALLSNELFRASNNAVEDTAKIVKYMKRASSDNNRAELGLAGASYLEQVDGLLNRFDFKKITGKALEERKSLVDWVEDQHRQGYDTQIPEKILNDAYKTNYKEMSFEDLKDLRDTVQQISHLAKLKNELISVGKARDKLETIQRVTSEIEKYHEVKEDPVDYAPNFKKKLLTKASGFAAEHSRPEYIFEALDGYQPHGPAWEAMFKPFVDAEDNEIKMTRESVGALDDIFSAYSKKEKAMFFFDKKFIPEIGTSMNKVNLLAAALNRGNLYNYEAVMEGNKWTPQQYDAILKHLDARDWKVVQAIWDHIDTYWPQVSELERKVNGLVPSKVQAESFQTDHGEMKGGYYPLIFDSKASTEQAELVAKKETKDLFGGSWVRAMTEHGHLKERTDSGGKPVLMELSALNQHLSNVIHDLTHREAVIDVYKLINSKEIKASIEGSLGKDIYRQLKPWLNAVAGASRTEPSNQWEKILSKTRSGATVVALGFNLKTALKHTINITTIADKVGAGYLLGGIKETLGSPAKIKSAYEFVTSRSELMQQRYVDMDRDIRDHLAKNNIVGTDSGVTSIAKPYMHEIEKSYFSMIGMADLVTSVPSWIAAYRKAMDGGLTNIEKGDEKSSAEYADSIIREVKGSGSPKDMASIQRGSEAFKIFTMFYSQMSLRYNQLQEVAGNYKVTKDKSKLISSIALRWFLPAIVEGMIVGGLPKKKDSESEGEAYLKWTAQKFSLYPFESMVGVRDFANYMERRDFKASPVFDVLKTYGDVAKIGYSRTLGQKEELKAPDYHSMVNAAGYFLELPTQQLWRSGDYLHDWMTGEERPANAAEGLWRAAVIGKEKHE